MDVDDLDSTHMLAIEQYDYEYSDSYHFGITDKEEILIGVVKIEFNSP